MMMIIFNLFIVHNKSILNIIVSIFHFLFKYSENREQPE